MEEVWKIAIGLTGIAGVGCFVFFLLYKEWIHAEILNKLTKPQLFRLLCLFLFFTFGFGLASLGLSAYETSVSIDKDEIKISKDQFESMLSDKYKYGNRTFDEMLNDPELTDSEKNQLLKIATQYALYTEEALDAFKGNNFSLWHHKNNQLHEFLRTNDVKKYIPESRVKDMAYVVNLTSGSYAWDPKLEDKFREEQGLPPKPIRL